MNCRDLCMTCKSAGLKSCPFDAGPLPLVEAEKPKVIYSRAFGARVWPADNADGVSLRSTGPKKP